MYIMSDKDSSSNTEASDSVTFHVTRHAFSCNNNLTRTQPLSTKIYQDPSITSWGVFQALYKTSHAGDFYKLKGNSVVYVSELVRTWQTAILLYLPHIEEGKTLTLVVDKRLNEKKAFLVENVFKANTKHTPENQDKAMIVFLTFLKMYANTLDSIMLETNLSIQKKKIKIIIDERNTLEYGTIEHNTDNKDFPYQTYMTNIIGAFNQQQGNKALSRKIENCFSTNLPSGNFSDFVQTTSDSTIVHVVCHDHTMSGFLKNLSTTLKRDEKTKKHNVWDFELTRTPIGVTVNSIGDGIMPPDSIDEVVNECEVLCTPNVNFCATKTQKNGGKRKRRKRRTKRRLK